jgi:serine/threonine protein phosphatase 1
MIQSPDILNLSDPLHYILIWKIVLSPMPGFLIYKKTLPQNLRNNLDLLDHLIYSEYESETGILWTRERLLNLGKIQIVGHTKQAKVRVDNKANAAYIDTGACAGNRLSSVVVHRNEIIEIIEELTHQEDI